MSKTGNNRDLEPRVFTLECRMRTIRQAFVKIEKVLEEFLGSVRGIGNSDAPPEAGVQHCNISETGPLDLSSSVSTAAVGPEEIQVMINVCLTDGRSFKIGPCPQSKVEEHIDIRAGIDKSTREPLDLIFDEPKNELSWRSDSQGAIEQQSVTRQAFACLELILSSRGESFNYS